MEPISRQSAVARRKIKQAISIANAENRALNTLYHEITLQIAAKKIKKKTLATHLIMTEAKFYRKLRMRTFSLFQLKILINSVKGFSAPNSKKR